MGSSICLFEDGATSGMYPLLLTRPAFGLNCAGFNLHEVARMVTADVWYVIRAYLAAVAKRDYGDGAGWKTPSEGPVLYLNASVAPDVRYVDAFRRYLAEGKPFLSTSGQRIAAALLPPAASMPRAPTPEAITAFLLEQNLPVQHDGELRLFDYPFHTVAALKDLFPANVSARILADGLREARPGVWVGREVRIAESAIFHSEQGPVVLLDGAEAMDFTYLAGPVIVGRGSRVIERSSVKDFACIGATCKIGGEVEASIVEDYTNKQHHGFLGHAHVGSWVNLGAGTSNSDLKNTYGTVKIQHQGRRIDTKMQFLGCVIGDYSKSAINTSIFTGKVIGVNSMLYGYVGQNVASFCNYAASFGQVTECSLEQALSTQKRMFERRKKTQAKEDVQLLSHVFELTAAERRMSTEAPVL
jgi:UDP-N-acetylglucosamine diphosphorylase / glucose-1-phosphate thymidylyltransferase / UDP-N-acetylgalactosamine diphosphorylase / glucosamine-1-phosphate N-acetyltransferase / galactosamine-1-phosphate N-acetyltransferase